MSILRLSVMKERATAPNKRGEFIADTYRSDRRTGDLGDIPETEAINGKSALMRHLQRTLEDPLGPAGKLGADAPVTVMVHGFLFDPRQAVTPDPADSDNPHGRLFHFMNGNEEIEHKAHTTSWPNWLGFQEEDEGKDGMAIAFGWHSQPGLAASLLENHDNFYARAYDYAGRSAWVLVNVLQGLHDMLAGHKIDIVCHSLGSRVVVRALAMAAKRNLALVDSIDRVIFLGAAEYVVEAQLMHSRLQQMTGIAGLPSFFNIVSREDAVLDRLGEKFGPRTFGNSQVIGHNGLDVETPGAHWIDLQIDSGKLQGWMSERGLHISGDRPGNVWDHWYYYTFHGNMAFYSKLLRDRGNWSIEKMRKSGAPDGVSRRWSIFGN